MSTTNGKENGNGNGNGNGYDWESIERDFRANLISILEISRRYKCPESTIRSRMKSKGIKRNLAARVKSRIKEMVIRESRTKASRTRESEKSKDEPEGKTFDDHDQEDESIIEDAAEEGAAVITHHRKDIQSTQKIVELLKGQLVAAAKSREELEEEIIEETAKGGGRGGEGVDIKRRTQLMRAVSLPAHSGVLRDLALAQKHLITIERTAWNLNDGFDPDDEIIDEIPIVAVEPKERDE